MQSLFYTLPQVIKRIVLFILVYICIHIVLKLSFLICFSFLSVWFSESLPFRLLPFHLWFVPFCLLPFHLLPFRLLWKFLLFPFRLLIITDKEIFFFFFFVFFMIIIHIQKYNITTQGIKLSKMPLIYEVKNLWIYTLCNYRISISLESTYKNVKPTLRIVIKPCFMS